MIPSRPFKQRRIQDLSVGGQDFSGTKKNHNQEQKIAPQAKILFDLKDSKKDEIND